MSVQKLRIKKGQFFVTILNKVAQGLSYNLELLGIYTYLCSLPPEWEFHKNHIQKECGIGEKKLDKLFNLLIDHGLIHVIHNRDKEGRFTFSDIVVNDGNSFINKDLIPHRKSRGTVAAGRQSRAIKDIRKKDKNIKKTVTDVSTKPKREKPKEPKQKKAIENTFYPDYKNQKLADHVADKCGTSGAWLIKRFIEITIDSGRKEYDFNDLFTVFLEKQAPVKDRRDFKGASQISKYI